MKKFSSKVYLKVRQRALQRIPLAAHVGCGLGFQQSSGMIVF
jgi:hypothetical protein